MERLTSVIMCALNQGDWVRKTIPLAKESLRDEPYEIILVDDQSIDGCCHDIDKDVRIYRPVTRLGVSGARRFAVEQAKGDILLFSDTHCDYPDGALKDLVQMAQDKAAICVPTTTSLPTARKTRYGGRLELSDRGLKVGHCNRAPDRYPALLGSIYAVQRKLYDFLGGWPKLPGVWGYSEQALTLMSWFSGVPIVIDDRHICNHQNYHPTRADGSQHFTYSVHMADQSNNGHFLHAAFFPKLYEWYFKPLLFKRFRSGDGFWSSIKTKEFAEFAEFVKKRAIRSEEEFFQWVLNKEYPTPHTRKQESRVAVEKRHRRVRARRIRVPDDVEIAVPSTEEMQSESVQMIDAVETPPPAVPSSPPAPRRRRRRRRRRPAPEAVAPVVETPPPAPPPVPGIKPGDDVKLITQQAKRSQPRAYPGMHGRIDRALRWFQERLPKDVKLKNCKAIDLGTRDGYGTEALAAAGCREALGVELVPETAQFARNEMGRNVVQGDMRRLSYKDGSYDVATCIHSMEHVPDPHQVMDEIARILKPGGWVLLVVPLEDRPSRRYAHNFAFQNADMLYKVLNNNRRINSETIFVEQRTLKRDKAGNKKYEVYGLAQRKSR